MKITVVTVSYNSEDTIADTLASVQSQTYDNVEHLIIDGASTDRTLNIVSKFASHNPRIHLISEPDDGIYHAMNKGFEFATGQIIGFLNADDVYADNLALFRIAEAFSDSNVEVCYSDLVYVRHNINEIVRYWKSSPYESKISFARGWAPPHPTFYIRRSALLRCGRFNTNYLLASDTEFMLRYLEMERLHSVYIPYVQIRMRMGGTTNKNYRNIFRQNKEIFQALKSHNIKFSVFQFVI